MRRLERGEEGGRQRERTRERGRERQRKNEAFKAYLESKSKMCSLSLTNTNQNPVVLSDCHCV